MLFVLIAGALAWAFFSVPVRGKTPWQHVQRLASSEVVKEARSKGLTEFQKPEPVKTAANGAAKGKDKPPAPDNAAQKGVDKSFDPSTSLRAQDKLTGKDQKDLDDLINQKVKKP